MSQKKVLVISNNPVLVDFLQKNLAGEGYRVVCVAEKTGEIASVIQEEKPDLVVVDIILSGMDGIRVSLNIRRKYDVPIIMLTSRSDDRDKVRGLDLSAEDHLSGSINTRQLMDWIRETFTRNAEISYSNQRSNGNGKKRPEDN